MVVKTGDAETGAELWRNDDGVENRDNIANDEEMIKIMYVIPLIAKVFSYIVSAGRIIGSRMSWNMIFNCEYFM
jgi:hypothetical protein